MRGFCSQHSSRRYPSDFPTRDDRPAARFRLTSLTSCTLLAGDPRSRLYRPDDLIARLLTCHPTGSHWVEHSGPLAQRFKRLQTRCALDERCFTGVASSSWLAGQMLSTRPFAFFRHGSLWSAKKIAPVDPDSSVSAATSRRCRSCRVHRLGMLTCAEPRAHCRGSQQKELPGLVYRILAKRVLRLRADGLSGRAIAASQAVAGKWTACRFSDTPKHLVSGHLT